MVNMRPFTEFEQNNLKFLVNQNVKFTQVEITPTGLKKGILDSTAPMRAYFLEEGVHNYSEQLQGPEFKQMRNAIILSDGYCHQFVVCLEIRRNHRNFEDAPFLVLS